MIKKEEKKTGKYQYDKMHVTSRLTLPAVYTRGQYSFAHRQKILAATTALKIKFVRTEKFQRA